MRNAALDDDAEAAPALVMGTFNFTRTGWRKVVQAASLMFDPESTSEIATATQKIMADEKYRPFRRRTLPPEIPGGEGIYLFDELMRGTDLPDMHIGGERNPILLRYCWRCLRRMAHPQSCHARLQYGRSSGFPKREGRRRCQSRQHPPTWLIGPRLAKHPGLPSQHQRSSPDHPACAQVK
jgi:hypothetical protein